MVFTAGQPQPVKKGLSAAQMAARLRNLAAGREQRSANSIGRRKRCRHAHDQAAALRADVALLDAAQRLGEEPPWRRMTVLKRGGWLRVGGERGRVAYQAGGELHAVDDVGRTCQCRSFSLQMIGTGELKASGIYRPREPKPRVPCPVHDTTTWGTARVGIPFPEGAIGVAASATSASCACAEPPSATARAIADELANGLTLRAVVVDTKFHDSSQAATLNDVLDAAAASVSADNELQREYPNMPRRGMFGLCSSKRYTVRGSRGCYARHCVCVLRGRARTCTSSTAVPLPLNRYLNNDGTPRENLTCHCATGPFKDLIDGVHLWLVGAGKINAHAALGLFINDYEHPNEIPPHQDATVGASVDLESQEAHTDVLSFTRADRTFPMKFRIHHRCAWSSDEAPSFPVSPKLRLSHPQGVGRGVLRVQPLEHDHRPDGPPPGRAI